MNELNVNVRAKPKADTAAFTVVVMKVSVVEK